MDISLHKIKFRKESGFLLLELSILIVIMGTMAVQFHWIPRAVLANHSVQRTKNNLHIVKDALLFYKERTGVLPCPASFYTTATDSSDGVALDGCHNFNCTTSPVIECDGNVRIGMVPFQDLEIGRGFTADGYNRRILYAVDKRFTQNFSDNVAAEIVIIDSSDNNVANDATMGGVVFALVSHGKEGNGAYDMSSKIRKTCSSSSTKTYENCDGNRTFRTAKKSTYTQGFDNIVVWDTRMNLMRDDKK